MTVTTGHLLSTPRVRISERPVSFGLFAIGPPNVLGEVEGLSVLTIPFVSHEVHLGNEEDEFLLHIEQFRQLLFYPLPKVLAVLACNIVRQHNSVQLRVCCESVLQC